MKLVPCYMLQARVVVSVAYALACACPVGFSRRIN